MAQELDCSESTIDELVRRGVLPRPIRLSGGCVRWCWQDVTMALASLQQGTSGDPYLEGVSKVVGDEGNGEKKSKGRN